MDTTILPGKLFESIRENRMIQAIKIFRDATGASLTVSKAFCDEERAKYLATRVDAPEAAVDAYRRSQYGDFPRYELEDYLLDEFHMTRTDGRFLKLEELISRLARKQHTNGITLGRVNAEVANRDLSDSKAEFTSRLRAFADELDGVTPPPADYNNDYR